MKSIRYLLLVLVAALASLAWAPPAAPSRPGLKYPVGNTVVSIDVAADTVTLQWSKSSVPLGATLQDYDWEISEYAAVDTSGTFGSNPNYGKFVNPLTASGSGVAPSIPGDPLYPVESVVVPANTFDYGKKYYWHVRAQDTASQYSYWSATGVFRVGVQAPTLGALTNNDTLRPTFSWTPNLETVATNGYAFELSLYPDFSIKAVSATIAPTALTKYTPTVDLLPNRTYYWRVRALNTALGNSKWASSSFTSAIPPTRPILKFPATNSLQMDLTPTFKWQPSVSQGDGVDHYELQISTNPAFDPLLAPVLSWDDTSVPAVATAPNPISGLVEYTLANADALDPAVIYYWRVLAYSTGGDYSYSTSVFKFTTGIVGQVDENAMDPGPTYGNVPGLTDPGAGTPSKSILDGFGNDLATGDNVNLLTLRPTFRWEWDELSLGNVTSFVLQIASAQSGGCNLSDPNNGFKPFLSVNVKANSVGLPTNMEEYTPAADLPVNQALCWRLQPFHPVFAPAGTGLWSEVQVFRTPNPPSAPTLLYPLTNTLTNDSSPRLVWSQVNTNGEVFGKYEVEISRFSDFKGYTYDNRVPPYVVRPITYPLPTVPMDLTDTLVEPIKADTVTKWIPGYGEAPFYDLYPQIIHAHDTRQLLTDGSANPDYEILNDLNEPWFQMHEDFDAVAPIDYGPLYGAETYYWRVRAYNANGEYSAWSAPFTIKIAPDRPDNVTVTFPNPTTLRPTVTWDPVILADTALPSKYYKVVFVSSKGTPTPLDDVAVFSPAGFVQVPIGNTPVYTPTVDLPPNDTMYVKVFAWDLTYGYSLYGVSATFTTPQPPLTPSGLIAPANGSLVQSVRPPLAQDYKPTFYWKLPAPDMTPKGQTFDDYQIQISENDPTFAAATIIQAGAASELTNSYQLTPLDLALTPLRTCYWRVRACSSDGGVDTCSAWTQTFSFKTAIKAPEGLAEDLTDPQRPILNWNAVPGAAKYLVYVKPGSTSCTGNVTPAAVAVNSYQFPRALAPGNYSWCVVAYDAFKFGASVMSEMRTFNVP